MNAPDMQRVRMSLPHYRAAGWEPVVLCVGDAWQEGVREPDLVGTVPSDISIIRCPALSLRWTQIFGLRNLGLRCWVSFLLEGSRVIRREKIDLVFFSNTQFVTFALGRIWRRWHGVPYVFDMQDPWRTDYYSRPGSRPPPGGWKYQIARFSAWILEGWSFARVAGIISVSPDYLADLKARYPHLARTPTRVVPFGGSSEDVALAKSAAASSVSLCRDHGEIHVVYTGAAGPIMPHALTFLFTWLRSYLRSSPQAASRLHFHFFGTSYVAPGKGKNVVVPLARQFDVHDQVHEVPHRLGHLECLRLQREADILLLPGSNDPAYSPSKIYPYFLAERPMLALVFSGSVLEGILNRIGGACVVQIDDPDAAGHNADLQRFFTAALTGLAENPVRADQLFAREFGASSLTEAQAALFDAATGAHSALPNE